MLKHFFLLVITLFSFNILAQNNYTISGYVQDESSGENLIGVSIYEKESLKGTSSNTYGFYSLTLPKGNYKIIYSYIGMQEQIIEINLNKNIKKNIALKSESILTDVITISEERKKNLESTKL